MRALLVLLALLAFPTDEAEACSCTQRSYAQHAKDAKQVLLARAGKPETKGDALKQTFTVLATLKGTPTKTFLFDRPATPPCASKYEENEVAILFTHGGDLDPCHGNWSLEGQIGDLDKILDATGKKRTDAKAPAVEAALREALAKYTHGRSPIRIRHAPLAGRSFQIGTSTLEYTKKAYKGEIRITKAFAADSIAVVEGTYNIEGLRFTVLLQGSSTWSVIWSSVTER
ncbi:MAG: hypothetical protein AB7T06_39670 [Kofleriaceae bacterium]